MRNLLSSLAVFFFIFCNSTLKSENIQNVNEELGLVEILPGKEGLLHISEIDWKRIEKVEDVLATGDKIQVKLIEIDQKSGKLRLSRKALIPKPEAKPAN